MLCIYGIQGKPKPRKNYRANIPALDSPEYKITNNGNGLMIQLKGKSSNTKLNDIENNHELEVFNSLKWHKYRPLNLYKALCKFIISIVNNDDLPNFKNTVLWLNNELISPVPSMVVCNKTKEVYYQPKIAYLIKNNIQTSIPPYCIGTILFGNFCYFFEVPFTEHWEYDNSNLKRKTFIKFAEKVFPQEFFTDKFRFIDFATTTHSTPNVQISFLQSENLVKGRDWIVADTKEEVEKLKRLYSL